MYEWPRRQSSARVPQVSAASPWHNPEAPAAALSTTDTDDAGAAAARVEGREAGTSTAGVAVGECRLYSITGFCPFSGRLAHSLKEFIRKLCFYAFPSLIHRSNISHRCKYSHPLPESSSVLCIPNMFRSTNWLVETLTGFTRVIILKNFVHRLVHFKLHHNVLAVILFKVYIQYEYDLSLMLKILADAVLFSLH